MKKKLKIILDYDDVLVDCNAYAIERLNKEIGSKYTLYDITAWGLLHSDIDKRLAYYSDPEFIRNIPLMEGAVEFVKALMEISELFIMTSVEPSCAGARVEHIMENFPDIMPSNILIGNRKDMMNADICLDDGFHNLENSNVTYPVLFQRPWNFGKNGVLSVNGYDEFVQLVHVIYNLIEKKTDNIELVSIIGPTGAGKKDIADALTASGLFKRVLTYTTKSNGKDDYHVLSFEDFTYRKENGFFFETSIYMGEFFGTRHEDILNVIKEGKIPFMILDINGAMAMQSKFKTLNVFIKTEKENCIREILKRNLPMDEAVQKITSLDLELRNEELCDLSISIEETDKIIDIIKNKSTAV